LVKKSAISALHKSIFADEITADVLKQPLPVTFAASMPDLPYGIWHLACLNTEQS
jgi:hypothetical protein